MSATEQYLEVQAASGEEVDVPLMVNYIIQDSLERGASDIHIEPWEDMTGVRVRVACPADRVAPRVGAQGRSLSTA